MLDSYDPKLKEKLENLFNKKELPIYIQESHKQRPLILRSNPLKIKRKDLARLLISRNTNIDPLEITPYTLIVYNSSVPLGATPEYLSGYYCIQGASSLLPVINMDIQLNHTVIDMCAAPGLKSTHISSLLQNTGVLFCYEINNERCISLRSNLYRMGVTNSLIINSCATNISIKADRILLDAPCSCTGVVSKDMGVINKPLNILVLTSLQKRLILKGFDSLKAKGILVYSTCSVLTEENEDVVEYLLRKRKNAVLQVVSGVGVDGFVSFRGKNYHGNMKYCKRVYPHVHNMDGFFIAKIFKDK
ncbi:tRNA/rRNA cytosine-C5-methylase [Hamiltosporidium tvaerminnensis]|uniref:tRNA/rRNA cytosine-C5-methylase n=2 Tax=Hamiltosporidium TaxID=1176354 RepID=A0A4V2JWE2_9MICR|nr:tRNA/rRNA cytosine-C5-methylase [Hamiltosporidium magnivora]TBU11597.1 tRNA/rRNA cytosine-C5-methylase [Hamiltosporidium tvaerminnensis]